MSLKSFLTNKFVGGGLFFVLSLFFALPAHAVLYQNISNDEITDPFVNNAPGLRWTGADSGNDPNSTTDNVETLVVNIFLEAGANNCVLEAVLLNTALSPAELISTDTVTIDIGEWVQHTFDFATTSGAFREDNLRAFQIRENGATCGSQQLWLGSADSTSTYAYGTGYGHVPTSNATTAPGAPFFVINDTVDNVLFDNASRIYFGNTPTSTCDFRNWEIGGAIGSDEPDSTFEAGGHSVQVLFGSSPNLMFFQDNYAAGVLDEPGTFQVFPFPKGSELATGTEWYAQAGICRSNDPLECDFYLDSNDQANIIAESAIWGPFIISGDNCPVGGEQVDRPGFVWPFATSTNAGDNITCDQSDGFFQSSLCNLFQFLFKPSNASINQFMGLKKDIERKPPFGYVSVYQEQIGNLSTASSTTSTEFAGVSSANSLHLASWATLSVFTTIKTVFAWFLWLIFVFYIYHRFRHFSLHG